MTKLKVLDLFSGIGGFSLGLERTGGFRTVAFCEYEPYLQQVLKKHWPDVPCFKDVRDLKGEDIEETVDIITGGYPCQPFSQAGKRLGADDDRHLWPEFNRIIGELRPTWVIGENVAGHIGMGLDNVLSDLEDQGYSARTFDIPSVSVSAHHKRSRVWTVAYSNNSGQRSSERSGEDSRNQERHNARGCSEDVAHTDSKRSQGRSKTRDTKGFREGGDEQSLRCGDSTRSAWSFEPELGRMADGLPSGMDGHFRWVDEPNIPRVDRTIKGRTNRIKALGNSVVPQIPEMLGRVILDTYK